MSICILVIENAKLAFQVNSVISPNRNDLEIKFFAHCTFFLSCFYVIWCNFFTACKLNE